ncbi:unnamed protein product [Acanthoscelides obtectus]|uniref:Uncharacterized protein n=1 Tax=Acanthoscelides obtectus TaxID=200917 RepID=A0A9P0M5S3_ACAOB|nr:unnamed protein product [Acanthoscelides obtectus]CAK1627208.1 hypothetical protein AOBTE_LOCUS4391 [Acanthoscelides obtectus]
MSSSDEELLLLLCHRFIILFKVMSVCIKISLQSAVQQIASKRHNKERKVMLNI